MLVLKVNLHMTFQLRIPIRFQFKFKIGTSWVSRKPIYPCQMAAELAKGKLIAIFSKLGSPDSINQGR